ncbi:hypothetical protein C0995_001129 [Termitomyces sp. Mi166|nr:hypothetical protein C0995_001129 [Termitomyces sp. Mi166\
MAAGYLDYEIQLLGQAKTPLGWNLQMKDPAKKAVYDILFVKEGFPFAEGQELLEYISLAQTLAEEALTFKFTTLYSTLTM